MAVTAKKLGQSNLSTSATTLVTGVTGGTTEVTSLWMVNTGSVQRKVTLYAHGAASGNTLMTWILDADGGSMLLQLNNTPIILAAGQTLSAIQDTGTDVVMTVYGIEEV